MKFDDETLPLYLETDASEIRLGAALLQTRSSTSCPKDKAPDNSILKPIMFAGKSLPSAERRCSNIKREALGILHGLRKIHHYCFAREVSIIPDHRLLIAVFKKDVAMLSHRMQLIPLRIQQYRGRIMYKPGPDLPIADWLSRQNHKKNKDEEIPRLHDDTAITTGNITGQSSTTT